MTANSCLLFKSEQYFLGKSSLLPSVSCADLIANLIVMQMLLKLCITKNWNPYMSPVLVECLHECCSMPLILPPFAT